MEQSELLAPGRSAVVVIDLQGKLLEMTYRWELAVKATMRLLRLAEMFDRPVILTEQYPEGLGPTYPELRATYDSLESEKRYVAKLSFGCCADAGFNEAMESVLSDVPVGQRQFVIAGIEAHVCVMQTVIELLRTGSQVHVCWECVTGRGEEYRRHALDRMQQAGARITNHESVAFEWARTKDHASFKAMNRLLREGQLS